MGVARGGRILRAGDADGALVEASPPPHPARDIDIGRARRAAQLWRLGNWHTYPGETKD